MTSTSFLCSTCSVAFGTDIERREHMREEWHVYNLKRRVASLPPISSQEYSAKDKNPSAGSRDTPESAAAVDPQSTHDARLPLNDEDGEHEDEEIVLPSPDQCVFCSSIADDIDENLVHMKTHHDFQIPDIDSLQTDVETLISYLALVVHRYFSCLYCGHTKHSAQAVQAHMLAKGHCMIDVSSGSEYLDFWDVVDERGSGDGSEDRGLVMLSENEMRLPSGATVMNRNNNVRIRPFKNRTSNQDEFSVVKIERTPDEDSKSPEPSSKGTKSQALDRRDQMGVVGLSDQQQRSLMSIQKKIRTRELRDKSAKSWTTEKIGNSQKHFKPDVPGPKNG